MSSVDFGKQIGPLPLGAWVVVVAGGLGIAVYSRRAGTPTPVPVEDTSGQPGVGTGPGWVAVPPPSTAPDGAPAPATNEEWGRQAINYLIAQGYDSVAADSAIRKYLEAGKLSVQEYALVRIALNKLGSPPVPLPAPVDGTPAPPNTVPPPPVSVPPPVVTPPPPPPNQPPPPPVRPAIRIWVVTPWPAPGSSLWSIAEKFYGNGNRWPDLYNANRIGTTRPDGSPGFISNPNYLRPGDLIWVP